MGKYVLKRLLHGLFSIVVVVIIVMVLVYGLLDRDLVFTEDATYNKALNNSQETYKYQTWEEYGYLDYVSYAEYLTDLVNYGQLDADTRSAALTLGRAEDGSNDSELTQEYTKKFAEYYEAQGYTIKRLGAVVSLNKVATGGQPALFAYRDTPLLKRIWKYFTGLITVDSIHYVPEYVDMGERGLTFTLHDPLYGGKFSPAIMGNGTRYKYLLYFDSKFPFIHQNLATITLGVSFTVQRGVDVWTTMTQTQGAWVLSNVTYPTGYTEESADDLHTATYQANSLASSAMLQARYTDDYTNVRANRDGRSKMGYSFIIGIFSVIMHYAMGLPLGVLMARFKNGLLDKIGTVYIMIISAMPSLAYIFLFRGIGSAIGLPTLFDTSSGNWLIYILPMVSLALPSLASMMKWMRRYMVDQMNSDYVKFARSGGMSDTEIFFKHIMKIAAIPVTHGIPGALLGAITGSIITERVYVVPGAGGMLTNAINQYDNSVIVGLTLFFAVLSVISGILGDVVMATMDPRISFTDKAR